MRRRTIILLACIVMCGGFAGCGAEKESDAKIAPETALVQQAENSAIQEQSETISNDAETIQGDWVQENAEDAFGFRFGSDKRGSVISDFSSSMYFDSDGTFYLFDLTLGEEYISFDGQNLSVIDDKKQDVLILRRIGKKDENHIDGEYACTGGYFVDVISELYEEEFGFKTNRCSFIFSGQHTYFISEDVFDYEVKDSVLHFFGGEDVFGEENGEFKIRFEDDKLYMTDTTDEEVTFNRIS